MFLRPMRVILPSHIYTNPTKHPSSQDLHGQSQCSSALAVVEQHKYCHTRYLMYCITSVNHRQTFCR